jgi:hypothetical protein
MSELAYNANGESFEIPANVTAWRVRRMKPRGAPELVYGRDGRPLMIPIDSDMDDLREAVSTLGRYRLDPINEDGRTVENVPASYIQVNKVAGSDGPAPVALARDGHDDAVREAMRLNTELAKSVIDRFPEMMTAAAELLRAADGAGLPRRAPRINEDGEIIEDDDLPAAPAGFDLNARVAQVVPMLMASLASGKVKMPGIAAMLDWRKATPSTEAANDDQPSAPRKARTLKTEKTAPSSSELPPIDAGTMAHFIAIQAQLSPEESALARQVAQDLGPGELRSWFDELSKLSLSDAVAKIRSLIVDGRKSGGAS